MLEFLTRLFWLPLEIMQGLSRRFLQIGRSIYGGLFPPAIKPPPPSTPKTTAASTCPRDITSTSKTSSMSSKSTTKIRNSPSPTVIASCVINMEPGQIHSPAGIPTSTATQNLTASLSTLSASSSLKPSLVDLEISSTITNVSNDDVSESVGSVAADSVTVAQAQACEVKTAAVVCDSGDCAANRSSGADDDHDACASIFTTESINKKRFIELEKRHEQQVNKRNVASRCDSAKVDVQTDEDLQSLQKAKKPRLSEELDCVSQGVQQDNKVKKNKKRRSKRKKEVKQRSEPLGEGESDTMRRRPPPPNHFIAIQISNKDIISKVAQFQQSLTEKELIPSWHDMKNTEIFRDAMVPVTKLHFTLHVMHLKDGVDDVEKAQAALAECCSKVHQEFVENPMDLTIEGLGHFRNNVIFAQIKDKTHIDRLTNLSEIFRSKFNELNIPVDPRPFNPHMTIAKISRSNKLYKRKIRSFPPDFISNCGETNFGTQRVTGLQLLRMAGEDKATGYYNCLGQYFFEDPLLITRHHRESDEQRE